MQPLTGEIGKWVVDGKQVGGFRAWTVFVNYKPPARSWVIAAGFWMLSKINTSKVIASFYYEDGDSLKLAYKRDANINLPKDYELDKLIIKPVKMTFEEDFDWRELE